MNETLEQTLNRLFSDWTDDEVRDYFEQVRDVGLGLNEGIGFPLWREYSRRFFGGRIACGRCGSDNHHTEIHPDLLTSAS
jgi:hypothetical protein